MHDTQVLISWISLKIDEHSGFQSFFTKITKQKISKVFTGRDFKHQ